MGDRDRGESCQKVWIIAWIRIRKGETVSKRSSGESGRDQLPVDDTDFVDEFSLPAHKLTAICILKAPRILEEERERMIKIAVQRISETHR